MKLLESTDHFSEGYINVADKEFYFKKLKPANPKGNVLIIPGFGAPSTQFLGMQHYFYEKGYCSIIFDLEAQGFSDGKRGYIRSYVADYIAQIDGAVKNICEKGLETILVGHSNGGLAATTYTLLNQEKVSKLVLFSPWFELTNKLKWYEVLLKEIAGFIYPALPVPMGVRGADAKGCTTNEAWLKLLNSDKQISKWSSVNVTLEVEDVQKLCMNSAKKIKVPVILIHGKDDPVTDPVASQKLFDLLGSSKKEKMIVDKNIHHPFLEGDIVKQLYQKVLDFIK